MKLGKLILILIILFTAGCKKRVTVYTIPSEADINIEGREYKTPATIKLKTGQYKVFARRDGYVPESFDMDVNNENIRFSYHLAPKKVQLAIRVTPNDAKIMLDEYELQNGINMVNPGNYRLTISAPSYRTVEEELEIDLGENISREVDLTQTVKFEVNMNYSDPSLAGLEPKDYSAIKFYSRGKGYTLKNIDKLKLQLGQEHTIELKESNITFKTIKIESDMSEFTYSIDSFNEASYIVDSAYEASEEINSKRLFRRLFKEYNADNDRSFELHAQYYSYFVELYENYNYDKLLYLVNRGSYSLYSKDLASGDLYQPLLIYDDLVTFIKLEEAGAEKSPNLISNIVGANAYSCLEHVLKNMSKDEINRPINYEADANFRGGISYLIFETEFSLDALKLFIKYGAKTDVKKVLKYYDFKNPGTIVKTTYIENIEGRYAFNNMEERKVYR